MGKRRTNAELLGEVEELKKRVSDARDELYAAKRALEKKTADHDGLSRANGEMLEGRSRMRQFKDEVERSTGQPVLPLELFALREMLEGYGYRVSDESVSWADAG